MPIISFLDTDLYKFTMQQAVCQLYPYAQAEYEFINRGKHFFPRRFVNELNYGIQAMTDLNYDGRDVEMLGRAVPFFNPVFLKFLKSYRFNPGEVEMSSDDVGNFRLKIRGPWHTTILWEVPLMALICETYYNIFLRDSKILNDNIERAVKSAKDKALYIQELGARFADFGTRRRFSSYHHKRIIAEIVGAKISSFVGTSNVELASANNIKAIGTHAHEWFMFHAAKYGYRYANQMALENWVNVYQGNLGIALSDTFTTDNFLRSFNVKYAKLFDGVRHDSGDPFVFIDKVVQHYIRMGIDPMSKTIIFSDGLNIETIKKINEYCKGKIGCSFGIGTNLTNDITEVTPLNIVIKMTACAPNGDDWVSTVKLSDNSGKHTGNEKEINICKGVLGI